jgi:hypothetical protein
MPNDDELLKTLDDPLAEEIKVEDDPLAEQPEKKENEVADTLREISRKLDGPAKTVTNPADQQKVIREHFKKQGLTDAQIDAQYAIAGMINAPAQEKMAFLELKAEHGISKEMEVAIKKELDDGQYNINARGNKDTLEKIMWMIKGKGVVKETRNSNGDVIQRRVVSDNPSSRSGGGGDGERTPKIKPLTPAEKQVVKKLQQGGANITEESYAASRDNGHAIKNRQYEKAKT